MYKVRVEPRRPGSKLQASPSHHSMAAPHSFHLSGVAEYRWPPERSADIELAGRLWGGVLAAKIITCHTGQYFVVRGSHFYTVKYSSLGDRLPPQTPPASPTTTTPLLKLCFNLWPSHTSIFIITELPLAATVSHVSPKFITVCQSYVPL